MGAAGWRGAKEDGEEAARRAAAGGCLVPAANWSARVGPTRVAQPRVMRTRSRLVDGCHSWRETPPGSPDPRNRGGAAPVLVLMRPARIWVRRLQPQPVLVCRAYLGR